MFKRKLAMAIACTIMANPILVLAEEVAKESSMVNAIASQYVNGMFGKPEEPKPVQEAQKPTGIMAGWEKFKKKIDPKIAILTKRETQEVAFNISATTNFNTKTIDDSFINKLELVHGGEDGNKNLLEIMFKDRINTAIGKAHMALTLCHPTTDTNIPKKRSEAIAHLSKNKNYAIALDKLLQEITPIDRTYAQVV